MKELLDLKDVQPAGTTPKKAFGRCCPPSCPPFRPAPRASPPPSPPLSCSAETLSPSVCRKLLALPFVLKLLKLLGARSAPGAMAAPPRNARTPRSGDTPVAGGTGLAPPVQGLRFRIWGLGFGGVHPPRLRVHPLSRSTSAGGSSHALSLSLSLCLTL